MSWKASIGCGPCAQPQSITVDNGGKFAGRAVGRVGLFAPGEARLIRTGKPVENGFIESFNGKLCDNPKRAVSSPEIPDSRCPV